MTEDFWRVAGTWVFFGLTASLLVFVLLYALLSPWWRTEAGRNIMAVMGSMCAIAVYFTIAITWFQEKPKGFYETRFVLFSLLFLGVTWRVVILVKNQVLARTQERRRKRAIH